MIPFIHGKHDDTVKLLNEHFLENTKQETLVAQQNERKFRIFFLFRFWIFFRTNQPVTDESILMEKYTKLLWKMRSKLGKNEYRYYTTLYEAATSRMNSQGKRFSFSNY